MKTAIELGKDGARTVFHRRGLKAWTHPETDPFMKDFEGEFRRGLPTRQPCPACSQEAVLGPPGASEGAGLAA